ncbi:MAG: MFS transporter [Acidobacteria bacterium]|nr:MFS transporter [Acidobacteriota bacterium]
MFTTLNWRALRWATCWTMLLLLAVVVGSRSLQNFDGALVAYLFGTLFATFGIVYRYAVWLQRPATQLYWRRGWQLLFSRRFARYARAVATRAAVDVGGQAFIFRRSRARGIAHVLLAWGCLSAFAITLPLTFGWIHFTLQAGSTTLYEAHVFGFRVLTFPHGGLLAFNLFHALNWSSLMVIAGAAYFIRRRVTDAGQIATQAFEMDWLPLVLLVLISVTGLGLTWDYEFMQGRAHAFMGITHAITVILLLVWLPFGKFFHVFQRPAQLGVALYQLEGAAGPQAVCPHTGEPFTSAMHVADVKQVATEIGLDFTLASGGSHLDLSPQGKRAALARAHLAARTRSGRLFG